MWSHLDADEVRRRTSVLETLQLRQVLSALAFGRGDAETAAHLLVEHLGRELSSLEDPRTDPDALEAEWGARKKDGWNVAMREIAVNLALPPVVAEEIVRLNGPGSPMGPHDSGCAEVAGNPSLPPHLVPVLSTYTASAFSYDEDEEEPDRVVTSLACNFGLPIDAYADIHASAGLRMRGRNVSMPIAWMEALLDVDSVWERQDLAKNIMLPEGIFELLADDPHQEILGELAMNPSATPHVLSMLARSDLEYVTSKVATHPRTPAEALSLLARSSFDQVRANAAGNASMDPGDLAVLSHDEDQLVRARVGGNASTAPDVIAELSLSESWSVRKHVASNRCAPGEVVRRLADDVDVRVRRAVAGNPIAGEVVLGGLAVDDDEGVRTAVHGNPSASEGIRVAAALKGVAGSGPVKQTRYCTWVVEW